MEHGLQDLLRYYERELVINERLREEFAHRFPQLASQLGADSKDARQDPHVQRLMQANALMNAHTAMRIDRGQDRITEALLHMNYPHFLRPFPSCTIVQFDASVSPLAVESVTAVARGTVLSGPVSGGIRPQFRTVYPVTVAPLKVVQLCFTSALSHRSSSVIPPEVSHLVSLTVEITAGSTGLAELGVTQLPLFIDTEPTVCAALQDALFLRTRYAWIECGNGAWMALNAVPLQPVGYADDEAILPGEARSHPAFRLLTEYGCFPEKFNFLRIPLGALAHRIPPQCKQLTLHFGVIGMRQFPDAAHLLSTLEPQHLRPFCTPAVNLFRKAASAIDLDHTKTEYLLASDAMCPRAFDIYSIDSVKAVKDVAAGSEIVEYFPYYSNQHGTAGGRQGRYWFVHRNELLADLSPGYEHAISFVDLEFSPLSVDAATVSIDLTCTNGDLPSRMPYGARDGDLNMAEPLGGVPIRILRRPTRTERFSARDRWRLVSHLALNHHSLVEAKPDALAELLTLYNLPQSPVFQRQVGGIAGLRSKQARWRWTEGASSGFLHGVELELALDVQAFAGCGLHAFAQVLDHFFGMAVHLNSFVQLVCVCHQTGKELVRCTPRSGQLHLL